MTAYYNKREVSSLNSQQYITSMPLPVISGREHCTIKILNNPGLWTIANALSIIKAKRYWGGGKDEYSYAYWR